MPTDVPSPEHAEPARRSNAEINAAIAATAEAIHLGEMLLAQGQSIVVLDANGEIVTLEP